MKKILFTLAICTFYLSDLLVNNALAVENNPYLNFSAANSGKVQRHYAQQPITIRYKYPTAQAKKIKEIQSYGTMGKVTPKLEENIVQVKADENFHEIKINNNNFAVNLNSESTILQTQSLKLLGEESKKVTQEELIAKRLEIQKLEIQRLEAKLKQERLEQERLQAKLEAESLQAKEEEARLEQERQLAKQEKARLEQERLQAQKLAQEKLEKEKLAQKLEKENLAKAKREQERLAKAEKAKQKQLAEKARIRNLEAKKIEAAMLKAQKLEEERREAERIEIERLEAQNLQAQKLEQERLAIENLENLNDNTKNTLLANTEEYTIEQTNQNFAVISNLQNQQEVAQIAQTAPKPQNQDPNRIIEYSEDWSQAWSEKPNTNNKPQDAKLIQNAQDKILTVAERTKNNSKLNWDILSY